jgi:hypothetical protein
MFCAPLIQQFLAIQDKKADLNGAEGPWARTYSKLRTWMRPGSRAAARMWKSTLYLGTHLSPQFNLPLIGRRAMTAILADTWLARRLVLRFRWYQCSKSGAGERLVM